VSHQRLPPSASSPHTPETAPGRHPHRRAGTRQSPGWPRRPARARRQSHAWL